MTLSAARSLRHQVTPIVLLMAAAMLASTCGDGQTNDATMTATRPTESTLPASTDDNEGTIDVGQSAVSVIYGAGGGDLPSDQPALATGDFDSDGLYDIAVGARFGDTDAGADAGSVYLIFGAEELPGSIDLARGEQGGTISGPHAGANFGFSIVAADFNNDGTDDLAVGAAFANGGGNSTGAVYLFYGPLARGRQEIAAGEADAVVNGENANGFFGDSLAAGDVTGDGIADLVVGATFDRHGGPGASIRSGTVYIFFGRPGGLSQTTSAGADATIVGEDDRDELGDFVTVGDVNGDGVADIIATAEAADGPDNNRNVAGEVYIIFGGESLGGTYDVASGGADVVIYGAVAQDTLGFSLAAGDLDGDGVDDLAIGARLATGVGRQRSGSVYLLPGGDLPPEIDLAAAPDSVVALHGAAAGDLLGDAVLIGDVDGDGRNELVIGSRRAGTAERLRTGVAYVIDEPLTADAQSIGEAASFVIAGEATDDSLGGNFGAADLNADGRPELVIVAENAPGPDDRVASGRVYVVTLD